MNLGPRVHHSGPHDQQGGPAEAGQDDDHPEDPRQLVRGGDVGQAVDGGGLQELLDNLHGGGDWTN